VQSAGGAPVARRLTTAEVTFMAQDLAALAPSAFVCVVFLIGGWMLLRRELAPKRRKRAAADGHQTSERSHEPGERSES
jgi:hypothetical protein